MYCQHWEALNYSLHSNGMGWDRDQEVKYRWMKKETEKDMPTHAQSNSLKGALHTLAMPWWWQSLKEDDQAEDKLQGPEPGPDQIYQLSLESLLSGLSYGPALRASLLSFKGNRLFFTRCIYVLKRKRQKGLSFFLGSPWIPMPHLHFSTSALTNNALMPGPASPQNGRQKRASLLE